MTLISRFHKSGLTAGLTVRTLLLALLWTLGCERPAEVQTADAAPTDQHQVPFHAAPTTSDAAQDTSQATQESPETGLPFQESRNLPAGTLLTVRLKYPISAENSGVKETFEAVVDEPVVIEGNRLVPRGASVAGRVESAQSSSVRRNHGYVRLALDSIHLAGANLPVQTSSLFVKGNASARLAPQGDKREAQGAEIRPSEPLPGVIRLEKGRRLTFRLTEPAYVAASQRTRADR
jgi:hypothetical protein